MKQLKDQSVWMRLKARSRAPAAIAVLGALLAFPLAASAQQVPPRETGPQITRATFANNQVQLRDAVTNNPLIVPRGFPLLSGQDPAVTAQISFQEQPSGFDLIYNMTNTAAVDKPLGCLALGIITLGINITSMDIREGVEPVAIDANNYAGWGLEYPTYVYSPAFILSNATHTMGITLQYPILEHKHTVKLNLTNPAGEFLNGEGGRGFAARFSLATNGPESWQTVQYGAILKPGESRRYVVSVRVSTPPTDWLRTLVPYRNYFRSVYGGVRYLREDTPVWAVNASDSINCSASNPMGFNGPWRPDLNGWSSMATLLREKTGGWGGTMVWKPSGSYWQNPQNNFPPQPASNWLSSTPLSTIFNPFNGMPTVSAAGKGLGFWWGRSCQTAATWDPPVLEDFDPDNPVHYNRQINELDLMARAGATMIGLDTFDPVNMPFWKQYRWMESMRLRYPHIKFVTEPTNCDIMQTMAATFVTGWDVHDTVPQTQDDCYLLTHPNYLADFLVPGHEYWGSFSYGPLKKYFGVTPDMNRVMADMQKYASYGYRPCFSVEWTWWGLELPPNTIHAAKTWLTSVPADLQISDAPLPLGLGLSTGSRPKKAGGGNVVAGFKPARPAPEAGRVNTSAAGAPAVTVRTAPATVTAIDPRIKYKSQQRRVADAIRAARGLPPLPPDEPPAGDQSDVQTFTKDGQVAPPAKAPPGNAPDPKK